MYNLSHSLRKIGCTLRGGLAGPGVFFSNHGAPWFKNLHQWRYHPEFFSRKSFHVVCRWFPQVVDTPAAASTEADWFSLPCHGVGHPIHSPTLIIQVDTLNGHRRCWEACTA